MQKRQGPLCKKVCTRPLPLFSFPCARKPPPPRRRRLASPPLRPFPDESAQNATSAVPAAPSSPSSGCRNAARSPESAPPCSQAATASARRRRRSGDLKEAALPPSGSPRPCASESLTGKSRFAVALRRSGRRRRGRSHPRVTSAWRGSRPGPRSWVVAGLGWLLRSWLGLFPLFFF